jgi:predicted HAD superfamily phosphohydrolase YqeG
MDALRFHGLQYISNRRITKGLDAVMFDIDDTLIFTNGVVNAPMLDLLMHAKSLGYLIVIITARPRYESVVEHTKFELTQLGIRWDSLAFCDANDKWRVKVDLGHRFVLSVGDMPTDLTASEHFLDLGNLTHG